MDVMLEVEPKWTDPKGGSYPAEICEQHEVSVYGRDGWNENDYQTQKKWCDDNCIGYWCYCSMTYGIGFSFCFEKEEDKIKYILKWM